MLTKNALLLPLATTAFMIARLMDLNIEARISGLTAEFFQHTLLAISLMAMLLLLLHIIKGFRGKKRTSVMIRTLGYYLIFVGIVLLGEHFMNDTFTLIACVGFMFLFTKKVFS